MSITLFPPRPAVVGLRPTLLAVMAHPDDESFGLGGTLAFYSWCGAAVYLICATGGECGTVDEHYLNGYNSIAELRRAELDCAANTLGLAGVEMLGYRDSGMAGSPDNQHPQALAAAPLDEVTGRIVQAIRRLRPQVVVTFDPIGGYRHPDHIAVHQATVRAFHAAALPDEYPADLPPYQPQKLYYQTFPRGLLRLVVTLIKLSGRDPARFGRNNDVDLAAIAREEFPLHATVDFFPVAELRAAAGRCHASQGGGAMPSRGFIGWLLRLLGSRETFMRAFPPVPPGLRERDLFADVRYE